MSDEDELWTRRSWLTMQLVILGSNIWQAREAVASTALEHPEWDMDEKKTWSEWESADPV